jgi:TRAP-type C4-dicarboxylate transport system substrate-binding protein
MGGKKNMNRILKSLVTVGALAAFGSGASATELQMAHFLPEAFPPNKAEKAFAEHLKEATNGEITVSIAFGGQLGGEREMLDFVANKVVDMAAFPVNHYASQFPGYGAFDLPLAFDTPEQVAALYKKALTTLPLTMATYEKAGVTPFMFRGLDPYLLLCNKPVSKVADFEGLRIRTFGSAVPAIFEGLGAVPVNLLSSETYEAFQRGTVDCVYFSRVGHLVFKTYEVAKYKIDFEFGAVSSYIGYINNDVLNAMTDDQRAAFWEASEIGEKVALQVSNAMQAKADEVFGAKLETMTIEDGDKIREKFNARWMLNHYVETMSAIGAEQGAVANEVADFVLKELGL